MDNIQGEKETNFTHYEVGKKVRKAIADIGGTMSEDCLHLKNLKKKK